MSDPGQTSSSNFHTMPDGRMSPVTSRSMKDFSTQISELKKENFSLKLRIFYMEERMQETFSDDYEQVFKTNIELKVECDSLRKELQDKHDLLVRASNAVACMDSSPDDIRKAQEIAQKELQQVKDAMHERVQEADKELRAVRAEADSLAENVKKLQDYTHKLEQDNEELKKDLDNANSEIEVMKESLPNIESDLEQKNENSSPDRIDILREDLCNKEKLIEQLREALEAKQTMVEALTDENKLGVENANKNEDTIQDLRDKNKELEDELSKAKEQDKRLRSEYMAYRELEHEYQLHISEQQQRLDEFEIAARQMSEELEKREDEVKDLSEALKDAEETGKELADNYDRLKDEKDDKKTKELLMRDKAISFPKGSGLTEVIRKKDEEIERLKQDAAQRESRLEELTNTITTLNSQEDTMGERLQRMENLEKELDHLKALNRELELKNKKLSSQLENSEELVRSMDERLKEKDEELQDLLSKYKELLRKQQEAEIAKDKAFRDQEDMAQQFEKEKREFADIMNSMKRQFEETAKKTEEKEQSEEIVKLQEKLQTVENHLRMKHLQLEDSQPESSCHECASNLEATNLFKKAENERKAALDELEAAMQRRDEEQRREMESRSRINAAKTAEIERLREEIRVKDDRIQNLEDDLLQLDRAAHEARDKSIVAGREATRWKQDSLSKDEVIKELTENLEALGNSATNSEKKQIVKLTRENVELKQLLKAREAELSFLQNEQAADDPYIESLKREIARKDKIIADERQLQDTLHNAFVTWSKVSEDTSSMNLALDALRLEIENHKRELNNAKNMVSSLTSELESSHQQVMALHQACNAKDRVIEDLKASQRYPVVESEEGSSTATENAGKRSRQQRYTKRKQKHRKRGDDASVRSSSASSAFRFRSDDDFDMLSSGKEDFNTVPRIKEELKNEIQDLHREINALKGAHRNEAEIQDLLKKLERQREHLKRLANILTEEQKLYREQLDVPQGMSHASNLASDDVTDSKHKLDDILQQVEDIRNKLCNLLLQVNQTANVDQLHGRESLSSTIHPFNQTSYMEMPPQDANDHNDNYAELQKQLDKAREELGDATKELSDLRSSYTNIEQLKQQITELSQELEEKKKEGVMKESEMSTLRLEVDKLRALQLKVGRDSDTDHRSLTSGDESDGMGALSRRELRESIVNLKKKLKNAEKLNGLLGNQIESARQEKFHDSLSADAKVTARLSNEVDRLKEQLKNTQEQLDRVQHERQRSPESPRFSDPKSVRSTSRSRLPVPIDKAHHKSKDVLSAQTKEPEDYANLKTQCAQLQNKLAATEETVRQQTEKLKKCKTAMAEAGLDVPLSPVKSARSHPNLLFSEGLSPTRRGRDSRKHARDNSNDTQTARTQTSADDTGYASVSPKSEEKYNSLIQAQAKELSSLRQQLKKARETCKDLRTEYDIVLRYVTTLLNTAEGQADTMLASSVTNELERCKQLTRRLKEQLSEWTSDGSLTSDSDESTSSFKATLAQRQASQLLQKSQEIDAKNEKIRELEERLANIAHWNQDSEPHFQKFKGQKVVPENLGYLTPTSSHHSFYNNGDEEIPAHMLRPTISQNTEYVPLPERKSPKPLADSFNYSPRQNRSLPMYQRTIAVTEYLPGHNNDLPGRRRLATANDAENCTASYGGSWGVPPSPRKQTDSMVSFKPENVAHSSPTPRDGNREVDRLRKKLDDSRKLNESLKEELDLTTDALNQATHLSNQGSNRNPADVLAEHLNEIRILRQRLESSIETNDRLREQLEKKLKQAGRQSAEHVSANIYLPAGSQDDQKYEEELNGLREELARANDQVAKLQNQLEAEISMKNNFAAASRELEQLRMRLVESSSQTEMLGSFIDDLNNNVEEKEAEIQSLRDQLEQADIELKRERDENEVNKLVAKSSRENADEANECANRMREDLNRLNEELDESHHLVRSLKSELALYEKIHKSKNATDGRSPNKSQSSSQGWNLDISELLSEIKSLRVQLERSIEANAALRKQLQEQLRFSRDNPNALSPGRLTTINIHHLPTGSSPERDSDGKIPDSDRSSGAKRKLKLGNDDKLASLLMTPPPSASSCGEDHSPLGFEFAPLPSHGHVNALPRHSHEKSHWPYYNIQGPYVIGKLTDYNELKQVVSDGRLLVRNMELKSGTKTAHSARPQQKQNAKDLEENLRLLHRMLEDSGRILKLFWPASLPSIQLPLSQEQSCQKCVSRQSDASSDVSKCTKDAGFASDSSINSEADGLRREVRKLHKRLSAQDKLLQSTVDRLQTANRLKEGIEHAILRQLTVTHDVLKKARGNLEAKAGETQTKE